MNVMTNARKLLTDTARMCTMCAGADKFREQLLNFEKRLDEPLKVAVIGYGKSGKSTLLNAIMKESILYTGEDETVSDTILLTYSKTKGITVFLKDGQREDYPLDALKEWTIKKYAKQNTRINDVQYIKIKYPCEVLKTIEFIDTPGFLLGPNKVERKGILFKIHNMLSKKTVENELAGLEVTTKLVAKADIIVYTVSKENQLTNSEAMKIFQSIKTNLSSPITAVGVLTKSDFNWYSLKNKNPIDQANEIAINYMKEAPIKNVLYTMLPVNAKMIESITKINDGEWNVFNRLSNLDESTFLDIISSYSNISNKNFSFFRKKRDSFSTSVDKINIYSVDEMKQILKKYGEYGICFMVSAIKQGIVKEKIIEYAYENSGIKQLIDLILMHFGDRARIIKIESILSLLSLRASELIIENNENKKLREICELFKEEIENIMDLEQVFKEIKVLRGFYDNKIKFDNLEEIEYLKQITGEYGYNCEARLGVLEGTNIKELAELAKKRIKYWNERANDILVTKQYKEAAIVLTRSYNNIYYHLESLLGEY